MKRNLLMHRLCIFLLVWAVALSFRTIFPEQVRAETPRYGGVLKMCYNFSPRYVGWPSSGSGPDINDALPCIETLLELDGEGNISPVLALTWKYSPDLKSLTLTLRKGVKFHDGEDFNAEAVKANLLSYKKGRKGTVLDTVESIDILDKHTLRLNLSKFKNTLLSSLTSYPGLMISPAAIKKGKKWAKKRPIGTGPFEFVKFERDVILKYKKFDGYWDKGKPYLDGIEVHVIKDMMTEEAALRAGEVHVMKSVPDKQALGLKKDGFKVLHYPVALTGLAPDSANANSIFADKRVREAIEYAIDKESIAAALGLGFWTHINQVASEGTNGFNPGFQGRSYDPEKAKELLAKAGYPDGFKTSIYAVLSFPGAQDGCAAIQRDLQKVGIEAKLQFVDGGKYYKLQFRGWKDGLLLFGFGTSLNLSRDLDRTFKTGAMRFPSTLRSAELNAVLKETQTTSDSEIQAKETQKAVRMMHDMAMVTPLWAFSSISAMDQSVHDAGLDAGGGRRWTPAKAWLSK